MEKKRSIEEQIEAWGIFMGLCEEFPELYDLYVEKVEKDMETYGPKIEITEEQKKVAFDKIWERIKNEEWE